MRRGFTIFILVVVLALSISHIALSRPFIWADDEAYWPAIYRGRNGKPEGIFNDIMTEVFRRLNIPLKKEVYPWKRAQRMVKEGEADGMVTVYTKERREFTVATEPIWEVEETLFFRRDNPKACKILKVNSFNDLKGFTLVDIQGSGWTKEQYEAHGIKNVIWVPDTDTAFNMIAKGRADIFIMFNLNAFRLLTEKRAQGGPLSECYKNIVAIMPSFAKLKFRLLIRKSSPFAKMVNDINRVLEEMRKDGTFRRIRQKYAGIIPIP